MGQNESSSSDSEIKFGEIVVPDGTKVFYRLCLPKEVRGAALLVHGMSEHSGRYTHVIEQLARWKIATIAPDHRGHGRTAKTLGYVQDLNDIVDDLERVRRHFLSILEEKYHRPYALPLLLWGHSMGGLISLLYLQRMQSAFSAAIIASAAATLPARVPKFLISLAEFLNLVVPKLPIQQVIDRRWVCRDPQILKNDQQDPLIYLGKVRVGTGAALIRGMKRATANLSGITLPALVVHGTEDRVVDPIASQVVFGGIRSADKTLRMFEGFYHELHNDTERQDYFRFIGQWINEHLTQFESSSTQLGISLE